MELPGNQSLESHEQPTTVLDRSSKLTSDVYNGLTTDELNLTFEHTGDDPKIPYEIKIVIMCISVIGLIANGFVIFVFIKSLKLRNQLTTVFLTSQSLTDFITALFIILCHIEYDLSNSLGSSILCVLIISEFPLWFCLVMSSLNLLMITGERYLMIVHPITHKNKFTRNKAYITVIVIALISCFVVLFVITSTRLVGDKCMRYYHWIWPEAEPFLFLNTILWMLVLPLVTMIVAYSCIFRAVRRKNKVLQSTNITTVETTQTANNKTKQEMNILKTAVMICVCFFICYTPSIVKALLYNMGVIDGLKTSTYVTELPGLLLYSNCSLNPFIYIFRYELFKKEAMQILKIK